MNTEMPTEILDLVRFMCKVWSDVDQWAYSSTAHTIGTYPVIQGTRNQANLRAVGRQRFNSENFHKAVRWMLDNPDA